MNTPDSHQWGLSLAGSGSVVEWIVTVKGELSADDRPEPPEPFIPFEVPLATWRDSPSPLCANSRGPVTRRPHLWADERGVFVTDPSEWDAGAILSNYGCGWGYLDGRWEHQDFTGIGAGGPLVLLEDELRFVGLHDAYHASLDGARFVSSVNQELYVLASPDWAGDEETSTNNEVWLFANGGREQLGSVTGIAHDIVAVDGGAYLAMEGGAVFVSKAGEVEMIPRKTVFTRVWSERAGEFWALTGASSIVHFIMGDFSEWKIAALTADSAIWGSGDKLYYSAPLEFGVIDDEPRALQRIDEEATFRFQEVWGLSLNEVFVTYRDTSPQAQEYRCGGWGVFLFDGTRFSQL